MTEPEFDSTGEPLNEAARKKAAAGHEVAAGQREAASRQPPEPEAPPPGSWRARLQNLETDTATMWWDGIEWEIPAEMPNEYYEASRAGDSRGMIMAIIGAAGMVRLKLPREISAEMAADIASEISEAAGLVWSLPNLNRSARRSRGTTKR